MANISSRPSEVSALSLHNCDTEKESDRQIYPTSALRSRLRCIIHLRANLEEPSQSPNQHRKEEQQRGKRGEREKVTGRVSEKEEKAKGARRGRSGGGENTRTKEPSETDTEKRECERLSLSAAMW